MNHSPTNFARNYTKYFTENEEVQPGAFGRINYVMKGDGLWKICKNNIGIFTVHHAPCNIAGFDKEHELFEGFDLSLPKIPRLILKEITAFFAKVCEKYRAEVYTQIFWDDEAQAYEVFVPEQEVSQVSVDYKPSVQSMTKVLVCEIHSHNSMQAFFSKVDDDDERERGDRFFGVIGTLDKATPEIKMSFIIGGGDRIYVDIDELFEEDKDAGFPGDWMEQISFKPGVRMRQRCEESETLSKESMFKRKYDDSMILSLEDLQEEECESDHNSLNYITSDFIFVEDEGNSFSHEELTANISKALTQKGWGAAVGV